MGILKDKYAVFAKKRAPSIFAFLLRLFFIIGFSYLFLFPFFYVCVTVFQDPALIDPGVVWIPKGFSMKGLTGVIKKINFFDSAWLTAQISVLSTLASLFSCSLVGYGFARYKFPLKNAAFFLVILTIIVPPQTLVMSNFLNFWFFDFGGLLSPFEIKINLVNTIWTFVLPSIFASGLRCGLFIFIFRQFFSGMNKELEEAAKIDGCGAFATYFKIMVPLAIPAFVTVLLFAFIWHWNDYYNSVVYFTGDVKPLSVMLSNLEYQLKWDGSFGKKAFELRMYLMSSVLLFISPLMVLYLFTQRFFTESIEKTGIVG